MKHYLLIEKIPRVFITVTTAFKSEIDEQWAKEWRENRLEDEKENIDMMAILITLKKIFIWKKNSPQNDVPSIILNTEDHLSKYYKRIHVNNAYIYPRDLEYAADCWLNDLTNGNISNNDLNINNIEKLEMLEDE